MNQLKMGLSLSMQVDTPGMLEYYTSLILCLEIEH